MEINLITAVFGAIGTFIGFLISVVSFTKNRDKDIGNTAAERAVTNTKLDTIHSSVESFRIDFKLEQKERSLLSERVARVEESADSAHKRIDSLGK